MLYMEKRLPPNLNEFSKVILTYAVCRRMDEAIYQHSRSLPSWTPDASAHSRNANATLGGGRGGGGGQETKEESIWPPSNPMIMRWRNSSCDCLDVLHWNANMVCASAGGFEHPTILHLHLSRLLILSPLRKMMHAAAVTATDKTGPPLEDALSGIRRWAIIDQFKARLSVVHAGAVLWHVRRYSTDGFVEGFAVYLATLVVWSYSISTLSFARQVAEKSGQQQLRRTSLVHVAEYADGEGSSRPEATRNAGSAESTARRENSDTPRPAQEAPDHEDEDDYPQPTFIHLDRPCDDEIVQVYVRAGHRMEGNMVRVGDICKPGAPQRILREGLRMLSGTQSLIAVGRDSHGGGNGESSGIRGEFVKKLSGLAEATAAW